jgi:hypothetical protein
MPAPRKRAGKRPRARNAAAAKVVELAFRMEEPLNEALDSVQELHLMGHGLTLLAGDEEGRPFAAVAFTARQRLDSLQQTWRSLCKAAVQARDAGDNSGK